MQKTTGAAFGGAPRGRRFAPPPWVVVFAYMLYDFSTIFCCFSMFFNDFCRKDWFPRPLLSRPLLGVTEKFGRFACFFFDYVVILVNWLHFLLVWTPASWEKQSATLTGWARKINKIANTLKIKDTLVEPMQDPHP